MKNAWIRDCLRRQDLEVEGGAEIYDPMNVCQFMTRWLCLTWIPAGPDRIAEAGEKLVHVPGRGLCGL